MRRVISRLINLAIAILVLQAWLFMTFKADRHGALSTEGLWNLRYFTVLSNLLQGGVSLCYVLHPSPRLTRWKYVATTAVALTFFVVLLFLGPVYGFDMMYTGANFWFHLVVPLLAMVDFLCFDRSGMIRLRDSLLALLPMLIYSVLYVGNLLINGVGRGADTNDWYGFAVGGPRTAAVVFLVMLVGNWVIALLLRLPRRRETVHLK